MILADEDTDVSGGDGVLEERTYHLQNWRHDVVALVDHSGNLLEVTDYTPYGEPIDVLTADFDRDGDVDLTDSGTFGSQYTTADCAPSGCTGDFDRDGDVDAADFGILGAEFGGVYADTLGTLPAAARSRGYAGYVRDSVFELAHVRHRAYRADLGTWTRRDPLGYVDGGNLHGYVRSNPVSLVDETGLQCANPNRQAPLRFQCDSRWRQWVPGMPPPTDVHGNRPPHWGPGHPDYGWASPVCNDPNSCSDKWDPGWLKPGIKIVANSAGFATPIACAVTIAIPIPLVNIGATLACFAITIYSFDAFASNIDNTRCGIYYNKVSWCHCLAWKRLNCNGRPGYVPETQQPNCPPTRPRGC